MTGKGGFSFSGSVELYIFVTSPRPDPYVNVLTHALKTYPLSAIYFVGIRESNNSSEPIGERLGAITSGIDSLFEQLTLRYCGSASEEETVATDNGSWTAVYKECLDKLEAIPTTRVVIPWSDLDKELGHFIARGNAMFDVTTLKKNLLVDVVALLLSRGCVQVYSFELLTTPKYDKRDLIHALGPNGYRYRSLAESHHVETAKNRMVARSSTFRKLLIVTAVVALIVLVVQIFFDNTWLQTAVLATATIVSIAGFFFNLLRTTH